MENSIKDTYLDIEKGIDKKLENYGKAPEGSRKYQNDFLYARWNCLENQIQKDLETIAKKFNYKLMCFRCAPEYRIICAKCKAMLK